MKDQCWLVWLVLCALTGCSSFGPPTVIGPDGPINREGVTVTSSGVKIGNENVACGSNLRDRFSIASAKAVGIGSANTCHTPSRGELDVMMEEGFALIYAQCNQFFADSGQRQTRLMVWRDGIALAGTLVAGAFAIDGGGREDDLAFFTLGSAVAMSGIDIHTRHYLFGAENVDSVRELTLKALNAHEQGVELLSPPVSYPDVVVHLLDHQAICTPSRIALLTREAIQKGEVIPVGGQDGKDAIGAAMDKMALRKIGNALKLPGSVSTRMAAAYYWILFERPTEQQLETFINPMLSEVSQPENPFVNGSPKVLKVPIPHESLIEQQLKSMTPASHQGFIAWIEDNRKGRPPSTAAPVPTSDQPVQGPSQAEAPALTTHGRSVRILVK